MNIFKMASADNPLHNLVNILKPFADMDHLKRYQSICEGTMSIAELVEEVNSAIAF